MANVKDLMAVFSNDKDSRSFGNWKKTRSRIVRADDELSSTRAPAQCVDMREGNYNSEYDCIEEQVSDPVERQRRQADERSQSSYASQPPPQLPTDSHESGDEDSDFVLATYQQSPFPRILSYFDRCDDTAKSDDRSMEENSIIDHSIGVHVDSLAKVLETNVETDQADSQDPQSNQGILTALDNDSDEGKGDGTDRDQWPIFERVMQQLNPFLLSPAASNTESAGQQISTPVSRCSSSSDSSSRSRSSDGDHSSLEEPSDVNLDLHNLCAEASQTDDVAWRNALYLLSVDPQLTEGLDDHGWTPLHLTCLGDHPPPEFMVRALLLVHPRSARLADKGGRLPIHLMAASSPESLCMQLLVQSYPASIYQTDARGLTPLHMLLKNDQVNLKTEHVRILLGQTIVRDVEKKRVVSQRRGQHLELKLDEIQALVRGGETKARLVDPVNTYPDDVRACFKKIKKWSRKQNREEIETKGRSEDQWDDSINPAAIAVSPSMHLALHLAVKRLDQQEHNDKGHRIESQRQSSEILRVLIASHPDGLVAQDVQGRTPLLIALFNQESLPSHDMVQVLLGMRTAGYESPPPSWSTDIPLQKAATGRLVNPAMLCTTHTHQLPLHVAAEEMTSHLSVLQSIHAAYPGASHVQDVRGRTPLHVALQNYRRISPDPRVLEILLTERAAQTRDDDGHFPRDLLTADNVPLREPDSMLYGGFFTGITAPIVTSRQDGLDFLAKIMKLPPWLRRHVFAADFAQHILLEEMTQPIRVAVILLQGLVLATLVVIFRMQTDDVVRRESPDSWAAPTVYGLGTSLLLYHIWQASADVSLSMFLSQCLFNIRFWVELGAPAVAIAASAIAHTDKVELFGTLGAAATGLLWGSVILYLANWWHGMGIFICGAGRLAQILLWPIVTVGVFAVGLSQMLLTLSLASQTAECDVAIAGRSLCSVREAYITLYLILIGVPLIDTMDNTENAGLSSGSIALLAIFSGFFALILLNLVITIIVATSRLEWNAIGLLEFWERKLTFIYSTWNLASYEWYNRVQVTSKKRNTAPAMKTKKTSMHSKTDASFESTLGRMWDILVLSLLGGDRTRSDFWFVGSINTSQSPLAVWPLKMIASLILPLWFLAGLVTLGFFWPPQVRRWVFRPPRATNRCKMTRIAMSHIDVMKEEILHVKAMNYVVENDIRELKELLYTALHEE